MDSTLEDVQLSVERFLFEKFEEKILENNIRTVFHYTTAEGLKGIIDSSCFFASRSDFLNDYTEMKYCWDLVLQIVDSLIMVCRQDQITRNKELEFYNDLKCETEKYCIEIDELEEIFVLSFTKNEDSLAMWSHYAGSDGYNIAIDLRDNIELWNKLDGIQFRYGAVVYNKARQQEIIRKEINRAVAIWNNIESTASKWTYLVIDALLYRIKVWTMFLKNGLFEEEQEVRIAFFRANPEINTKRIIESLHSMYPESEIDEIKNILDKNSLTLKDDNLIKQFRVRNNIIYPFIKIAFETKSITGVRVGPINKLDKAVLGLSMYLASRGLKGRKVDRSKCPLRF